MLATLRTPTHCVSPVVSSGGQVRRLPGSHLQRGTVPVRACVGLGVRSRWPPPHPACRPHRHPGVHPHVWVRGVLFGGHHLQVPVGSPERQPGSGCVRLLTQPVPSSSCTHSRIPALPPPPTYTRVLPRTRLSSAHACSAQSHALAACFAAVMWAGLVVALPRCPAAWCWPPSAAAVP